MRFNRPIPNDKPRSKVSCGVEAVVHAEKLMQIALLLPSSVGIGWLLGAWADSHFHQTWMAIAGIIFGSISGLVYIIRMAITSERDSRPGMKTGSGPESGNSDTKP
jgi:F0F1-type ATP synthase assembly protein I